jgi:hypothetical protein
MKIVSVTQKPKAKKPALRGAYKPTSGSVRSMRRAIQRLRSGL